MTLDIDREAASFIIRKGGICVLREIHPENLFEPLPQLAIEFRAPDSERGLAHHRLEGFSLYVDRRLFFKDSILRIRLGRFLRFRWLELPTHTFFAAGED